MGRSATFVNTTLIGSRPNRANTTCSPENMWREVENKKSTLHTFPNDKSGVKRGENLFDRTWEWHKTESEREQNRRQTRRMEYSCCPRGDWGQVRGLKRGLLLVILVLSHHYIKQMLTYLQCGCWKRRTAGGYKASANLIHQVPSSLVPDWNDLAEDMKSAIFAY